MDEPADPDRNSEQEEDVEDQQGQWKIREAIQTGQANDQKRQEEAEEETGLKFRNEPPKF